jgi:hypothetical protein
MKKVLLIIIALLLVPFSAYGEKLVEVTPSNDVLTLTTGESTYVDITVKNNQPFTDTFSFSVFPSSTSGVSVTPEKNVITIESGYEQTVRVYFSAQIDAPENLLKFSVLAKSLTTDASGGCDIAVFTKRKTPIYISNIAINKYTFEPEEKLTVEISLTNLYPKTSYTYELQMFIKYGTSTVQEFDEHVFIKPAETVKVTNEYKFGKYEKPGQYNILIYLKDENGNTVSTKEMSVTLLPVVKIPSNYTEKTTSIGFLSLTTTIVIKNDGNTVAPPFYLSEELPIISKGMFSASIAPAKEEVRGSSIVYSWYIPYLAPGEAIVIKYQVSFLGLWLTLIIIGALTYFSYRYTFTATVVKTCKYHGPIKKDKEILVAIEVKNKTVREMNDVTLTDRVPGIVQVVERFDTLPPKIKKSKSGTELVWSFGTLKPREERIVTYRIKPVVDVAGSLRLPVASISYTGKKGLETVFSKSVLIQPK